MNHSDWSKKDLEYIWHPCSQMKDYETLPPIVIERGQGIHLYDVDGKRYLDVVSSWWCNLLGHSHPKINQAIKNQLDSLEHVIFANFSHKPAITLCEELMKKIPQGLCKFNFSDNGSASIESAMKMSFQYHYQTGNRQKVRFMSLSDGYHGETLGALSAGGLDLYSELYKPLLLAIAITTVIGIPFGVTTWSNSQSISETFSQLPQTFGAIFSAEGFPALFSDPTKLPLVIVTIFAFSMSDTFDTLGTFIGTGRRTGIFSAEDEKALENGHGFSSKMDKALFADSIATSIGAICGTSNTTTYVESSAGIAAGGRTGLTSVVVAICFALSAFLAPVVSAVPSAATAGVLVIVGCMMAASLKEVKWDDIAEAIPAFFAAVFMAFSYSISYGIAGGFIMYCIVKTCKGKAKEVHPIIWTVAALFILDFVCMAIL